MPQSGDGLVVFVYEFMAACGAHGLELDLTLRDSLLREGTAMLLALVEDFAAVPTVQLVTMCDHCLRMPDLPHVECHSIGSAHEEQQTFQRLAAKADWTLVVAPEMDGVLLERSRLVQSLGGRLLGAGIDAVQVGSDKNLTAERWLSNGVPHPSGVPVEPGRTRPQNVGFPAILKPADGAGSSGVCRVQNAHQWNEMTLPNKRMRLESYSEGLPASVAVLHSPAGQVTLPAFSQHFLDKDEFTYLGGELLMDAEWQRRARDLALHAASVVQSTTGYIGVDIVLGKDPGGADDVAIELNPRITTSYIGLRHAVDHNLAEMLLELAMNQTSRPTYDVKQSVEFWSDGKVSTKPTCEL